MYLNLYHALLLFCSVAPQHEHRQIKQYEEDEKERATNHSIFMVGGSLFNLPKETQARMIIASLQGTP